MGKMVYNSETACSYKEQVQKICDYPELWDRAASVYRRLAILQKQGFPLLPALEKKKQELPDDIKQCLQPDAKLATQTYGFVKQLQWVVYEIAKLESMKLRFALTNNCKEIDELALTELERLLEILDPD